MKMICDCIDGPLRQPQDGLGDICAVCHAGPLPSEEEVRAQFVAEALAPLLVGRVREASADAEWLTAREAARLLGMSPPAVYAELARNPTGQLAQAASRLGRRLRFSRTGLHALLTRPPLRRHVARGVVALRVPSPARKESGRW